MATRTIYVQVEHKKTRKPLGVAACKTLADRVLAQVGYFNSYRGEYVAGGTRFLSDEPDPTTGRFVASPVVKIRADDYVRNRALNELAKHAKVVAVWGHNRELLGGKRA